MSKGQDRFSRLFLLEELHRMAGLARYPMGDGTNDKLVVAIIEELLLTLNEACVTEEHVRETISEWLYEQTFFPTPADLRQQAWAIRPRYDPGFTVEEPKYLPAAPPAEMPDELRELWEKACANVDAQDQMWRALKRELKVTDFSKVSWLQIAQAKEKLGYELKPHERTMLRNAR